MKPTFSESSARQLPVEVRGLAAMRLAPTLVICQALLAGIPVIRSRLVKEVLQSIGEPLEGPPLVLDDELALRVEAARPVEPKWDMYEGQQRIRALEAELHRLREKESHEP